MSTKHNRNCEILEKTLVFRFDILTSEIIILIARCPLPNEAITVTIKSSNL